jgi:ssDNA-binding Zn-finger/Zn-ribbon topoisomerase 1
VRKKKAETGEICEKCKVKMKVIDQTRRLLDRDEVGDLSDGEEAEYITAELGGDLEEFGIDQVTYECPKCHEIKIIEFL